jgi:uncharacterized protein (TIRG00374 family)
MRRNDFWETLKNFVGQHSKLLLGIGGVLLLLYVFVPQIDDLKLSIQAIKSADIGLLLLALVIYCMSFPIVTQKYCSIAQFSLRFRLSLQVQIASAFITKVLPLSIGSLAVNTFYLKKVSRSTASAASTMTFNALTSSIAFIAIVITALIASWGTFTLESEHDQVAWLSVLGLITIVCAGIWLLLRIGKINRILHHAIQGLWQDFQTYRKYPKKIILGIALNGLGSLASIATLYISTQAIGMHVTFAQAVISYALGNIIGSLVPTPGGLGGVEAGLYSGLVFFGHDTSSSLAAVCLYRLITYWLPTIPGYIMYRRLRKTILSGFSAASH